MVDLQELIIRGRLIFAGAPKRLQVFEMINGKLSTKEIARKIGRSLSSVLQDIEKLRDIELVRGRKNDMDLPIKKDGATVYEKNPLVRHVSVSYFQDVAKTSKFVRRVVDKKSASRQSASHIPTEKEILDICKNGEDQLYEFKAPGVDAKKISREVAGFLHTRKGGILFYGVNDDGTIIGSDARRQEFDQKIHNSVRHTISPQPTIAIHERNVMGSKLLLVSIPPWDRKTIYQYTLDGRYLIRKGTNIFAVTPEEMRKLSQGDYVD